MLSRARFRSVDVAADNIDARDSAFHDHGPAFSGPPAGRRCSEERHAFVLFGVPAPDTLGRWTTASPERELLCRCCRYPIASLGEAQPAPPFRFRDRDRPLARKGLWR